MNNINPEISLSVAPSYVSYGIKFVAVEVVVFSILFIYFRTKGRKTSSIVVFSIITIALTLVISFALTYLSVLPLYNLTN